jgi:hypothetical protein
MGSNGEMELARFFAKYEQLQPSFARVEDNLDWFSRDRELNDPNTNSDML